MLFSLLQISIDDVPISPLVIPVTGRVAEYRITGADAVRHLSGLEDVVPVDGFVAEVHGPAGRAHPDARHSERQRDGNAVPLIQPHDLEVLPCATKDTHGKFHQS